MTMREQATRFYPADSYTGPISTTPLLTSWHDIISLPRYSLIDVDGVVYERVLTQFQHSASFAELGQLQQCDPLLKRAIDCELLLTDFFKGNIKLLRVGK